jgi:pimeloyl-ACP methyl ester carboxylesterase
VVRSPAILIAAGDSPAPLRALAGLLLDANPSWQAETIARGGHMAPLTRPWAFNALVVRFLDAD